MERLPEEDMPDGEIHFAVEKHSSEDLPEEEHLEYMPASAGMERLP